jgi:hypothetical protein
MGKEKFEYDEKNLRLSSRRSGFSFTIGDPVRVRVGNADPIEGKIDFELADKPQALVREKFKPSAKAEKYQRENTKAFQKGSADELDLDAMPVKDHSQDISKSRQESFDPGKKLEEALRRRGLTPNAGAPSGGKGYGLSGRIGFGKDKEDERRRGPSDRRRRFDDEKPEGEERQSHEDRDGGSSHDRGYGQRRKKASGNGGGGGGKPGAAANKDKPGSKKTGTGTQTRGRRPGRRK